MRYDCVICGNKLPKDRKKYCSVDCMSEGYKNPARIYTCEWCGSEFESTNIAHPTKYCSKHCKAAYSAWYKETYLKCECEVCGKEFYRPNLAHKGRFCSRACSGKKASKEANATRSAKYRKTKNCKTCGKEFEATVSDIDKRNKGYCSRHCFRKRNGDLISKKCEKCKKKFLVYPSENNRRFCSDKCRRKWFSKLASEQRGENSPTYRRGHAIYHGGNWRKQSLRARERDNYTCQECGVTEDQLDRALDVHHIKPFECYSSHIAANRLPNLISLCRRCHKIHEALIQKEYFES